LSVRACVRCVCDPLLPIKSCPDTIWHKAGASAETAVSVIAARAQQTCCAAIDAEGERSVFVAGGMWTGKRGDECEMY